MPQIIPLMSVQYTIPCTIQPDFSAQALIPHGGLDLAGGLRLPGHAFESGGADLAEAEHVRLAKQDEDLEGLRRRRGGSASVLSREGAGQDRGQRGRLAAVRLPQSVRRLEELWPAAPRAG